MKLRCTADRRALVFTTITLALLLIPFIVSLPVFLCPIWIGFSAVFCFNACVINHNHAHSPLFEQPLANRCFGLYLTLLRGHSSSGVIVPHNFNHHIKQGDEEDWIDPKLAGKGPGLARLGRYVLQASIKMARQRMLPDAPRLNHRGQQQVRLERVLLVIFVVAMLSIAPATTLLFLVLPWLLGVVMLVAVNLPQHDGCDAHSKYAHSRDFTGRLGNWFLFNNGFHSAHHEQPGLHWSELPEAHRTLLDKLDPELIQRSMLGYIARHYVL